MTMDWKSETSPQVNACQWDAPTDPAEKNAQPTGMNLYKTTAYRHQGARPWLLTTPHLRTHGLKT